MIDELLSRIKEVEEDIEDYDGWVADPYYHRLDKEDVKIAKENLKSAFEYRNFLYSELHKVEVKMLATFTKSSPLTIKKFDQSASLIEHHKTKESHGITIEDLGKKGLKFDNDELNKIADGGAVAKLSEDGSYKIYLKRLGITQYILK